MKQKRTYPYGRTKKDSVAQPIASLALAETIAAIAERVTGEAHNIISRGPAWHLIIRITEDGKRLRA